MAETEHWIWICQVLCPQRHCIVAVAFDIADVEPDEMIEAVKAQVACEVAQEKFAPSCGLCGSSVWYVEAARSRWKTMEEAKPHIEHTRRLNVLSRSILTQRGDLQ